MVRIRLFNFEEDYDTLKEWWKEHGSFAPKEQHLSKSGLVVELNKKPVCAGFMYSTDSKICVFEFVVCDPKVEKKERDVGLNSLIEAAKIWAKQNEYELIYNSVKHTKYINRLEKAGFIIADQNQTHLFCEIDNE